MDIKIAHPQLIQEQLEKGYRFEKGKLPNIISKILDAFPEINLDTVVIAYDGAVYTMVEKEIPFHIFVHEFVHLDEQKKYGADEWWDKYINDPYFRLVQEIMAYQTQYKHVKKVMKDRNQVAQFGMILANELCSPMYRFDSLNKAKAYKLIIS